MTLVIRTLAVIGGLSVLSSFLFFGTLATSMWRESRVRKHWEARNAQIVAEHIVCEELWELPVRDGEQR